MRLSCHNQRLQLFAPAGTLGGFDSFQMEGAMAQLVALQCASERIKDTPLPRAYSYFTGTYVYVCMLFSVRVLCVLFVCLHVCVLFECVCSCSCGVRAVFVFVCVCVCCTYVCALDAGLE